MDFDPSHFLPAHHQLLDQLSQTTSSLRSLWQRAEADPSLTVDLETELTRCERLLQTCDLARSLNRPEDAASAFVHIQAGTGGNEAFDWTGMLARQYQRWAERQGLTSQTIEGLPTKPAGYEFVVLRLSGPFVFGRLEGEIGAHRLVRQSPFDPGNRRTTSFALVDVLPDYEGELGPVLSDDELERHTFRTGWRPGSWHL
jgi:peptide chain release factor 2